MPPHVRSRIFCFFGVGKNKGWERGDSALAAEICAGPHNRLLRRQHCSSLCSQSEGHEHVANMTSALGHDFIGFLAHTWPPQYSPPSLCEQSELQCFASNLRQMSARCPLHCCPFQGRYRLSINLGGVLDFEHLPSGAPPRQAHKKSTRTSSQNDGCYAILKELPF